MKLTIPDEIAALLKQQAPVAVGVSGGKDSIACALAVAEYLQEIRHKGPKVLVHSSLGMVEWQDSFPSCERLAFYLRQRYLTIMHEAGQKPGPVKILDAFPAWNLHTVRRRAGGMMERWEGRWEANMKRWRNLECVKVILPWSTPSMRFCTAELKRDPICSFLRKQFPKTAVISVTGIRADESPNRAKMPAAKPNNRLHAGSMDWNPIIRWNVEEVWAKMAEANLEKHEAYRLFGASRVSCAFCIMSAPRDLVAGLSDDRNREVYERMCKLELVSGFAFQANRWLSELDPKLTKRLEAAKLLTQRRQVFEELITKDMCYVKGWPLRQLTDDEADALAYVRREVGRLYYGQEYQYVVKHVMPDEVKARYQELLDTK